MALLKNAWYVAAFSGELTTTTPLERTLLGEKVVLYRGEAGKAVALSNRCAHRFAPLHRGKVKGDCIECPYHGLQFDASGSCSHNPQGDGQIPAAAKVRAFPLIEREQIAWIWMGDKAPADGNLPPDLGTFLGSNPTAIISGYFGLKANYELVLDNLLDLSHAPYLHPTTLAQSELIDALRIEMKQEGNTVWAYHYMDNVGPSPQFKPFWDPAIPKGNLRAHMRWDPPSNLQLDVGMCEIGKQPEDGLTLHMAHLLTPATDNATHYFWLMGRNFVMDSPEVSTEMQALVHTAFQMEDEPMIEAVADMMGTNDLFSLKPVLLPGDAAGIRVRRILQTLRDTEAKAG